MTRIIPLSKRAGDVGAESVKDRKCGNGGKHIVARKFKLTRFVPTEYQEQATVIAWARISKLDGIDMLFATLNGLRLPIGLAVKAQKAGMNSGVPDLVLPVARHGFNGFFCEMKRTVNSHVQDVQAAWRIRLQEEGYKVVTCKGAAAAINEIKEYLTEKEN